MQSLESSSFHGSREPNHDHSKQIRNAEFIYQRHEHKDINDGRKLPPLIIEDETKNYVDGIDDSSDGEPESKIGRGSLEMRQKKTRGRVKIKMEFIENKLRRYTTFSKRKTGIMKKVCPTPFSSPEFRIVFPEGYRPRSLYALLSILSHSVLDNVRCWVCKNCLNFRLDLRLEGDALINRPSADSFNV